MKRIAILLISVVLLLNASACSLFDDGFDDTPETEAAFAAYEAAVKQSIAHKSGTIHISTENKDSLEKTETLGVIEYTYSVDSEGRVTFDRVDYTDGKKVAAYKGDGKKANQWDPETDTWQDATEPLAGFLDQETNTMNDLSLFRIDNSFEYNKRFFETVEVKEAAGEKVITVVLKGSEVTEMMSYTDEREIKREMAGQTRTYYVNAAGDFYKIVVESIQNIEYQGKDGVLSSVMTVDITY